MTGYSVALDSYEYKPIDKPKNLDGLDSVELWPHNAQATCLIFYKGTNTVKYVSGKANAITARSAISASWTMMAAHFTT